MLRSTRRLVRVVLVGGLLLAAPGARAADCNANGVEDADDISRGTSLDCNASGVPDECEVDPTFVETGLTIPGAGFAVAAADLDGDEDNDIATSWDSPGGIGWFRNTDGVGSFSAVTTIDSAEYWQLVGGDLNGDGTIDLIGARGSVRWYPNLDGAGNFGPATTIVSTIGATGVELADLDADGDLDVASASESDDRVAWYENLDGAATFGPQRVISLAAEFARRLAAVDFDGDGDTDLVSSGGPISWFSNLDGHGDFAPQQDLSETSALAVQVTDLDHDGDPDVLASDTWEVYWLENTGASGVGPREAIYTIDYLGYAVFTADLDDDGDPDVLSASYFDQTIAWSENTDGSASFGPKSVISDTLNGAIDVTAARIDGDGTADVVAIGYLGSTVAWFRNEANDCNQNSIPDDCEIAAGTSTDCDANGRPDTCDLAVGSAGDCNSNLFPDACDIGEGSSADCTADGVPDECEPDCNANFTADSCDIDAGTSIDCSGNGVPDECEPDCNANAWADSCDIYDGTSYDCDANGVPDECDADCNANSTPDACDVDAETSPDCDANGVPDECDIAGGTAADCDADGVPDACTILASFDEHVIESAFDAPRFVVVGDIGGDADIDVAAARIGRLAWYANVDGQGTFGAQSLIDSPVAGANALALADLDGDSDPDVLGALTNGGLDWYENQDGLGSFGPLNDIGDGPRETVVAVDLDGDGDLDVLSASDDPASVEDVVDWFENLDGAGAFGSSNTISQLAGPSAVAAGDLDGDGTLDVVVASVAPSIESDGVVWYANSGQGLFGPEQLVGNWNGGEFASLADLDGDSDLDVLVTDHEAADVLWFDNADGAGGFAAYRKIASDALGVRSVLATDMDGDGDLDVVAVSELDDTVAVYDNSGVPDATWSREIVSVTGGGPWSVDGADLDQDGDMDLVVAANQGDAILWYEQLSEDCNANSIPDSCDVQVSDCNGNGLPDECEPDCNGNGTADGCDIASGTSLDCDAAGVPDECQPDCNRNGIADPCDIAAGTSVDCGANGVPDECEPDCDGNGVADRCDLDSGTQVDCNLTGVPDACELAAGTSPDCNGNAVPDECDISSGSSSDCNANAVPDLCDVASGASDDCSEDGVPDECENDCDGNAVPDPCEADCDLSGTPDVCEDLGPNADCNLNQVFDACETGCVGAFCDFDDDGCQDAFDCDPSDALVWYEPSAVDTLTVKLQGGQTRLTWGASSAPGAVGFQAVRYDVLRDDTPDDFASSGICLSSGTVANGYADPGVVAQGDIVHYLVRARNDCPGSAGTLGSDSTGTPRTGPICP